MLIALYFLTFATGTGIIISFLKLTNAYESKKWPAIYGKIIESRLEQTTDEYKFRPYIKYKYKINEIIFENDNYNFGVSGGSEKDTLRLLGYYPVGKEIKIHYKPQKPNKSVIIPGAQIEHFIPLLVCVFFFYGFLHFILNNN